LLTSIVAAAIILAVLIVVHEAGHFAMAKRLGVRVIRFSIGYPPKVWGIRRGETEYSIGATPFGGYVRMLGEEVGEDPRTDELQNYIRELALDTLESAEKYRWKLPTKDPEQKIVALAKQICSPTTAQIPSRTIAVEASGSSAALNLDLAEETHSRPLEIIGRELKPEEADVMHDISLRGSLPETMTYLSEHPTPALMQSFQKRSFPTQKLWKRFAIVLAGPAANIIFAPILMTVVFLLGVPMLLPVVGEAKDGLPAHAAGLLPGDRIVSVNGQPVEFWNDFSTSVKTSNGTPIKLDIQRGTGSSAVRDQVTITPKREDEATVYGNKVPTWIIGVTPRGDKEIKHYGPVDAVEQGVGQTVEISETLMIGLWQIVNGSIPVRKALGGPIMIAQMAGEETHEGLSAVLMFTVMISLQLGILNLLPVPLLDGGHLLFFAFEGLRGKPLQVRTREMALQVGLLLIVALMVFAIFNDISHIVQG
jgi:regulator of sigma E protease